MDVAKAKEKGGQEDKQANMDKLEKIQYCPVCEKPYRAKNKKHRFCSSSCYGKAGKSHLISICSNCHKEFHPKQKDRLKFCSRECAFELKTRISEEKASIRKIYFKNTKNYIVYCLTCGVEIKDRKKKFCTEKCWRKSLYKNKVCRLCGGEINYQNNKQMNRKFCDECMPLSKRNARNRARRKRRVSILGLSHDFYYDYEVFMKDKWHCRACGIKVTQKGDSNNENYANVDHILPISRGGADTIDNVQTLCRKCNILKADCLDNEWMSLIENRQGVSSFLQL